MGMMAGTDKGREIRRYFLECEHQLKQLSQRPQTTVTNADIPSALEELEKLIISIRSHARAVHTCTHQPIDELLAKSLHSLSHNQLNAIASLIHQMQTLKQFAETDWTEPVQEETTVTNQAALAPVVTPLIPESNTQVVTEPLPKPDKLEVNQSYNHSITIQCNSVLYTTLPKGVEALHDRHDFTYSSVTDVIRAALKAYQDGMELSELVQPGKKKQTSIRLDDSLYQFYRSLPNQLRTQILERAIRTFIKNPEQKVNS